MATSGLHRWGILVCAARRQKGLDMHARAIETRYKGYRFRSRLEARWAVFFDALGLKWEYEPEGFELPSGRYLPDFKVEYLGRDSSETRFEWFECKGDLRTVSAAEWQKMIEFQDVEGLTVLDGVPDCRMYLTPRGACSLSGEIYSEDPIPLPQPLAAQIHAYEHERFGLALWCSRERLWWDEHCNFFDPDCDAGGGIQVIREAVSAARGARFEHGESGGRK